MPVYVYRRRDGSTFETEQRMAEDALVDCPTTGQSVERVLQPFAPRYTGTGFYSTDHKSRRARADRVDARRHEDPRRAGAPRERRSHTASVRSVGIERSPAFASEPKLERAVAALERKRSTSSQEWALAPLRVRSLDRVRLHAELTILA